LSFGQIKKVLVFTKTAGYDHGTRTVADSLIQALGNANGFGVDTTNVTMGFFNDVKLAEYAAICFINVTGTVFTDSEAAAFERYMHAGGGYVGMHAATDCEYNWPWYSQMTGANFNGHPFGIQTATLRVLDKGHPSTQFIAGDTLRHTDEWYFWAQNPAFANNPLVDPAINPNINVLISLDETSIPGSSMSHYHPICWYQNFDGGRVWYTGFGHYPDYYRDTLVQKNVLGGILWAAGLVQLKPKAIIDLQPGEATFSILREGNNSITRDTVVIANSGIDTLRNINATTTLSWLTLASLATKSNNSQLVISINDQASLLAYGHYSGAIAVTADSCVPKSIMVSLDILPGGPNLALNKPVTASSVSGNYLAAYVNDGQSGTRWQANAGPNEWIYVDLGQSENIAFVRLSWEAAFAKGFKIQMTDNPAQSNWTTLYTDTNNTGGVNNISVTGTGRYIRMLGTQQFNTGWGYSLYEFEVYAAPTIGVRQTRLSVHRTQEEAEPIVVYDMSGKKIATLHTKQLLNKIKWNGMDEHGRTVIAGIYLMSRGSQTILFKTP
jgi:type 1 glutamine amidotransferase